MSRDKDIESCLALIGEALPVERIHFVQVWPHPFFHLNHHHLPSSQANNFRAVSVERLQTILCKVSSTHHSAHQASNQTTNHQDQQRSSSLYSPLDAALDLLTAEAISTSETSLASSSFPVSGNELKGGTLLACGSGFIMSSIFSALGIHHPK
jgi:hypothetical protein